MQAIKVETTSKYWSDSGPTVWPVSYAKTYYINCKGVLLWSYSVI